MKKWSSYKDATVVFTKKHWMTSETFIIFLKGLRLQFPKDRDIGLIVDKASSHINDMVLEFLEETNKTEFTRIHIKFIDSGMTSIQQPADVSINAPLKYHLRRLYHRFMMANKYGNMKPGDTLKISRENIVGFILEAYRTVNIQNTTNDYIRRSFTLCGLNPFIEDDALFQRHLDRLYENKIYQSLLKNNNDNDIEKKAGTDPTPQKDD